MYNPLMPYYGQCSACLSIPYLNLVIQCHLQSAGMVCFYIISKRTHPYEVDGDTSIVPYRVRKGKFDLSAVNDPVACDLIEQMLAHEPQARPPAKELLR